MSAPSEAPATASHARALLGLCVVPAAVAIALSLCLPAPAQDPPSAKVGMPAVIEALVLPGPALRSKAIEDADPIIVRILATHPHGTAMRYDLEWFGLVPGEHDLRAYLVRADGSGTDDLPPIPVTVVTSLTAGDILPIPPEPARAPRIGGYRMLAIAAAGLWGAGFLALLLSRRRRRSVDGSAATRPPTFAERLRPLVAAALDGTLTETRRAELEMALLHHWRRRLELGTTPPAAALARLREHPEAGPLVRALEEWLHRPGPPGRVDLDSLLAPYRDIPGDELEATAAPARR